MRWFLPGLVNWTLLLLRCFVSVPSSGVQGSLNLGHREGLLVIPGLGRSDRLNTALNSLQLLSHKLVGTNAAWDCMVYVYAPREWKAQPDSIWYQEKKMEDLRSLCQVIENPNKKVTENLHMVQPALIKHTYSYVFVLLDDCELQASLGTTCPIGSFHWHPIPAWFRVAALERVARDLPNPAPTCWRPR